MIFFLESMNLIVFANDVYCVQAPSLSTLLVVINVDAYNPPNSMYMNIYKLKFW